MYTLQINNFTSTYGHLSTELLYNWKFSSVGDKTRKYGLELAYDVQLAVL